MKLDAAIIDTVNYSYQDCTTKIRKKFIYEFYTLFHSQLAFSSSSYATGLPRTQSNHSCLYATYTRYISTMYAIRVSERERQPEGKSKPTLGGSRGSGCSSDGGCVG